MKSKRTYRQNEPGWLMESFLIAAVVFGAQAFGLLFLLTVALQGFSNIREDAGLFVSLTVLSLLAPLIMYPEVIGRFSWNVHLDENKIWTKGDRIAAKWFRVQLPVEAEYSAIISISIEHSSKNSSGQSIRTWFYGPRWSNKRYLVLLTDQGKKKRLHVSHFADATLAEMIDEIAARCEASGKKYDGQRAAQILFSL